MKYGENQTLCGVMERKCRFVNRLGLLSLFLLMLGTVSFIDAAGIREPDQVRNVILLIPDGLSSDVVTLTRWYQGGDALELDSMAAGMVRTYSADAPIADSAPAGTAFATGWKSHTGFIGVLPDVADMPGLEPIAEQDRRRPVASILEAARLDGKSVGLVATSEIMHATPAAFSAHDPSRKDYDDISEQQLYQMMDVVLGGGYSFFQADNRKDSEDLLREARELGYLLVGDRARLMAIEPAKGQRVAGLFAPKDLSFEMDRDPDLQPSIAEMTAKAIELLGANPEGFFLMVEGSKIDWAAHANDPIGLVSDVLAFDEAVGVAKRYAEMHGDTLVISVTDHGNSGLTIGDASTSSGYDKLPLSVFVEPLRRATMTGEGIGQRLDAERTNIRQVMADGFGIEDLTDAEHEAIKKASLGSMNYVVGPMIASRAKIGFTTNGHTGEDVTLYVHDPAGSRAYGVIENTDVAKIMADRLGLDLAATTESLFVRMEEEAALRGVTLTVDGKESQNPVLVMSKGSKTIRIPKNRNYALTSDGQKVVLDGVVVFQDSAWFGPAGIFQLLD